MIAGETAEEVAKSQSRDARESVRAQKAQIPGWVDKYTVSIP